ncbi:MAG: hypothetical protein HXY30_12065 [Pseudorhodoplanes sp.]|nr:hypothetical protein [Pseudorhodoplanes sp.]
MSVVNIGPVTGFGCENEVMLSARITPSPSQKIARSHAAMATPTIYIVTPDGKLFCMGAIDDKPSSRPADIEGAKSFVDSALSELKAGKPVSTSATRACGCTVKHRS